MVASSEPVKDKYPFGETELRPDAWRRFERAVDAVSKSGPKHKSAPRAAGGYRPPTTMIVYDVERSPAGRVRIYEPYLLNPDGSTAPLIAF